MCNGFTLVRAVVLILAVSFSLLISWPRVSGQNQQQNNQQRPRRVGGGQPSTSDSATVGEQQTKPGEEIGEGDIVRVDTQLVSVPTVVTDRNGHPLAGLKATDFTLFEDGKPQRISNFATTETPFEIALLLDTSGSTRDELSLIAQAANAFINALRPGDRVALIAFSNPSGVSTLLPKVDVLSPLTGDRKALRRAIGDIGTSNGTPFYDALRAIGSQIFRDPPSEEMRGRRAVVALTDGVDSTSNSDFAEARNQLQGVGVASYFIELSTEDYVEDRLLRDCQDDGRLTLSSKQLERFRSVYVPGAQKADYQDFCRMGPFERMDISRKLYNLARQEMNELAKSSGGKNFTAADLQDARSAFAQVANEIGTQYSLGYYPENHSRDGRFRTIKVELKSSKDAKVRAREGYYAPKGQ